MPKYEDLPKKQLIEELTRRDAIAEEQNVQKSEDRKKRRKRLWKGLSIVKRVILNALFGSRLYEKAKTFTNEWASWFSRPISKSESEENGDLNPAFQEALARRLLFGEAQPLKDLIEAQAKASGEEPEGKKKWFPIPIKPMPWRATQNLIAAFAARILRTRLLLVLVALFGIVPTYFLVKQTSLMQAQDEKLKAQNEALNAQNKLLDRQNNLTAFEQTSKFRDMLLPEIEPYMQFDSTGFWPEPNQSKIAQINFLGKKEPQLAMDGLMPLIKDSHSTVSTGAIIALQGIQPPHSNVLLVYEMPNLSKISIPEISFKSSRLKNGFLNDSYFGKISFLDSELADGSFKNSNMEIFKLKSTNISSIRFNPNSISDLIIEDSMLQDVSFDKVGFENIYISDTYFVDTKLSNASFGIDSTIYHTLEYIAVALSGIYLGDSYNKTTPDSDFSPEIVKLVTETLMTNRISDPTLIKSVVTRPVVSINSSKRNRVRFASYLIDSQIIGSSFSNFDFKQMIMIDSDFIKCDFLSVDFGCLDLEHVDFYQTSIRHCQFYDGSNLDPKWQLVLKMSKDDVSDLNFSGIDLSYISSRLHNIYSANFSFADLSYSIFQNLDIYNTNYNNSFQNGVKYTFCEFDNSTFKNTTFVAADFLRVNFIRADFSESNLLRARFVKSDVEYCIFSNANLSETSWSGLSVRFADFAGSDMRYIENFDVTNWKEIASIKGANIYGMSNTPEGFREWALAKGAIEEP